MTCEPTQKGNEVKTLPLDALVESLLFVAGEPASVESLSAALSCPTEEVERALEHLAGEYQARGVRLQRKGQHVQLVSAPEAAEYIRRFLGLDATSRLSAAAIETLAIIAYRQPVTRGQIQALRGVDSDGVLRTLLNQGLIEERGRLEQVGRPIVYGTSFEFLQHFGLRDLGQLPPLESGSPVSPAASPGERLGE